MSSLIPVWAFASDELAECRVLAVPPDQECVLTRRLPYTSLWARVNVLTRGRPLAMAPAG
jgi:hypothetical protein